MNGMGLGFILGGLALSLACSSFVAYSAGQCSAKSYREARAVMTSRLLATGYSKTQASFLMRNADRMISAHRTDSLNDNGRTCGIDSARAQVLGYLDKQLFPLKPGSGASLDGERQTEAFWGRKRLTVRELLFIGQFHGCLGAAKEHLFRG
ncbi:hypothetical protein FJ546_03695 [Mesorhizobium sp. B2-4-19]|uniref:hypothetical protein n=1 Tax=Mesorhizobium sp. B2-4-19 TaxID=2589930 RepID=UPI00112B6E7A|nr:hypothetical protein [Mesorhizobium sp. B2-4-19]TPK67640.1 hypothetical protein FJ546_03695 [Mesorhizobium sp. B2-4-19]